ncbi:CPBP family intramembrane glutamic endopeptidase [Halogeometricum limi]|uniref:CAAX prenyl protease 2/Lysostaphin resistance protein A-like domain-containing protein n=1 Tax=Halogeometricum limi TaxID=555875 RepID=A0A1I6FU55_9EURY|nr:CPBP family intramembrane glutamic endopeptidase [Halogeometricum limi]SFR33337.1 hypothetical protein SAMN04488124_0284 [Halogeometricum limi]
MNAPRPTRRARLVALVWNGEERRPTAPVRLILAVVVLFAALVVAGLVVALVVGPAGPPSTVVSFAQFVLLTALTFGLAVVVDRRTIADLGLGFDRDWWLDLGFGLVLGGVLMTAIFVVALAAGWVRVEGTFTGGSRGFLLGFALLTVQFLGVGISEELLVRGYLLTNVAEGFAQSVSRGAAAAVAILVSSVLFGVAHLSNPNATLVSALGISLAGVLLGLPYLLTDELAIPIGIHISWNLSQGGVYGFAVSGLGVGANVIDTAETGPDVFTGGAFGPEAGLLGVAAVVLGTGLVVWYVRWRYGEVRLAPGVFAPELRWRG